MSEQPANENVNVNFIRLLFTDPVEEEVAYRWASRFAWLVGEHAMHLRPGTTLEDMLRWAVLANVDSMDFAVVFEPELRMEFAEFLDHSEHVTLREMVQHYANRFGNKISRASR